MKKNPVVDKSKAFAIRIVRLYGFLTERKREFVLSKQLLRSGTSIGANVREGVYAQTKSDFIAKMCIALKEAAETEYWLELLYETKYLNKGQFEDIYADSREIMRLLTTIVKTAKSKKTAIDN